MTVIAVQIRTNLWRAWYARNRYANEGPRAYAETREEAIKCLTEEFPDDGAQVNNGD